MENQPLQNLAGDSWFLPGPTNIGVCVDNTSVSLIDSGNDKDAGRKMLKILVEKGWSLKTIVNTHSNADHIGANSYLQGMTTCEIWATAGESALIENPILESSLLWGGYPFRELRSKFFEAKASRVTRIIGSEEKAGGLTFIPLPGHFVDMTGVLTKDGVFFLGDSLFGEGILGKYKIPFIYDVQAFKKSLGTLSAVDAVYFVPSHGEVCTSIDRLAAINRDKVEEIEAAILHVLGKTHTFEDVFAEIATLYGINLDFAQYALAGSTIRSFLSYLKNEGKARFRFEGNKMLWSEANS
jgi:glyoxylase-like metal-dependent hydrolase (beta-lactamase superfamily II)